MKFNFKKCFSFYPVFPCMVILFLTLDQGVITAQQTSIIKVWQSKPLYATTSENRERREIDTSGVIRYYNITVPTLEFFKPENPTGTAVIICPGGGYGRLAYSYEGRAMAEWFARLGISAFILKYRLPDDNVMIHKEMVPLSDAQQAILELRQNFREYGIDPDKIGIIGFSAGGHLAATLSTHFLKSVIPNEKNTNLRPDFSILIYPVITMEDTKTHSGSKTNLLGENPSESLVDNYSNEKCVTHETPPTFIIHASDDSSVPVENSISYYQALKKNNVPVAMYLFQKGGHGFAMRYKQVDEQWLFLLEKWLTENKFLVN